MRPDLIDGCPVLARAGAVVLLFLGDRHYVTAVLNEHGAPVERHRHTSRTGAQEDFEARRKKGTP